MDMRRMILAVALAAMAAGTTAAQAPATLRLRAGDRVGGQLPSDVALIDYTAQGRGRGYARGRADNQGRQFQVSARQQWTPTGIFVQQGQTVQFNSTGEITLNQSGSLIARPAGATNNQYDRMAPLPNVPVGALIGRVGNGRTSQPFLIGDRASVVMPMDGELYLSVNDSNLGDNGGEFTVYIGGSGNAWGRGPANDQVQEFQVPSRQPWLPTGITVRQGEVVRFDASGEITLTHDGSLRAQPAGATNSQADRNAPMSSVLAGALIGRIGTPTRFGQGSARVFLIGNQRSVVMPFDGELLLGINDSNFDDNGGSFTVRVIRRG